MPSRKRAVKQPDIVRAFAERLKALRAARGMSQKELAGKAVVTLTYISRLEAGGAAPGIDMVEKLAVALESHVSELLPSVESSVSREDLKLEFDALLQKAGPETLSMLSLILARFAVSPTTRQ